jgi:hypothetical protein
MVGNHLLTFEVWGLNAGVLLMYDRETGSVWHHFNGEGVSGHYQDRTLDFLPVQMMRWDQWKELYPDTLVLSDSTGYEHQYRAITPGAVAGYTSSFVDTRLPANALVLGVQVADGVKAYPQQLVSEAGGVVNDFVGTDPVTVFFDTSGSGLAYSPIVDERVLQFSPHPTQTGRWTDSLTGSMWDSTGTARSGEMAGKKLRWVTSFVTEWYGWAEYHPQTPIFGTSSDWARVRGPAMQDCC